MPVSDQLRQVVIARGQAIFNAAVDRLMSDLENGAPVASGATKRGLRKTPVGSPPLLAVQVASTAPGGDFVEAGTPAHIILPRNGSVLVFKTDAGDVVFTRRVDHPGTTARPWFRPVMDRWPRYLAEARGAR